ncbi:hypothetical protein [Bacillus chungangensis]|uniref:Uncharacterized protein n=1 Tax=Bacillus chungangensis TaxID=587633 RepID=A0ABT9WUD2_9BACI|nr:hypothetical protein [Bacillus chungangensis]MDQ0176791.1 hypothetical protein [Bacillus chungangensis]
MKRISFLVMSLMLLFGFSPLTTNAADKVDLLEVEKQVNELEKKYGFEEVDLSTIPEDQIFKFDSGEEFEQFIKALQQPREFTQSIKVSPQASPTDFDILTTYYNDSDVISWWAPFLRSGTANLD